MSVSIDWNRWVHEVLNFRLLPNVGWLMKSLVPDFDLALVDHMVYPSQLSLPIHANGRPRWPVARDMVTFIQSHLGVTYAALGGRWHLGLASSHMCVHRLLVYCQYFALQCLRFPFTFTIVLFQQPTCLFPYWHTSTSPRPSKWTVL